jgi:hypothetical protein
MGEHDRINPLAEGVRNHRVCLWRSLLPVWIHQVVERHANVEDEPSVGGGNFHDAAADLMGSTMDGQFHDRGIAGFFRMR